MLENLTGLKWIGDLSLQDADVLAHYARRSKTILEFGAGGSTQIMAQCGAQQLISVETDPNWITLTQRRLDQLPDHTPVEFLPYTTNFDQMFDLIFVDGIYTHRMEFANAVWRNLVHGGFMIFHDTRRWWDVEFALDTAKRHFIEVSRIDVNAAASNGRSSNMTVIHKKFPEPYENWNETEGKPLWAYGAESGHEDQPLWQYNAAV